MSTRAAIARHHPQLAATTLPRLREPGTGTASGYRWAFLETADKSDRMHDFQGDIALSVSNSVDVSANGIDEVWTLDMDGATGGTLEIAGFVPDDDETEYTVASVAFDVAAATLESALETHYGAGNVDVGLVGDVYTITLQGSLAKTMALLPTLDVSGITGGPPTLVRATRGSGSRRNKVASFGINLGVNGQTPLVAGNPSAGDGRGAVGIRFEDDFVHTDGTPVQEIHLIAVDEDGTERRIFANFSPKVASKGSISSNQVRGDSFSLVDWAAQAAMLTFSKANSRLQLADGFFLKFDDRAASRFDMADNEGTSFTAWQIETSNNLKVNSTGNIQCVASNAGSSVGDVLVTPFSGRRMRMVGDMFSDDGFGIFGTLKQTQAAFIASPSADAASLKTAVDLIRTLLIDYGFKAAS